MSILLIVLSLLSSNTLPPTAPQKTSLKIDVQNVRTQTGAVYVAIYRPDNNFPSGKPLDGKKLPAGTKPVQTTFSVEPGDYAIAVYHDENGNGKMDKRVFGIPKEPYGFSNNFRPTMSAPKFSDCKFTIGTTEKAISIKLN